MPRGLKSLMIVICLSVFPPEMGTVATPSFSAPQCKPRPPVNRPYPYALWKISDLRPPAATIPRATIVAQISKSFFVYPTIVGFPLVPDEP
ncbi:hypothetical protein SRABI80_03226 [Peribacillus frigoritolerans]|nr:hypothetical protein SRABI80_03226 [Peribacillus frigoritolerans]